jgi:hypothetical protein
MKINIGPCNDICTKVFSISVTVHRLLLVQRETRPTIFGFEAKKFDTGKKYKTKRKLVEMKQAKTKNKLEREREIGREVREKLR